ncbi:MAG TPA: hypothetical protein VIV57_08285 [Anaeromyxobacter sp.]
MADESGIPPEAGAPPWAAVGVQLLDALVQRLKGDDPDRARDGDDPDRPERAAEPARAEARLRRWCRLLARRNDRAARALGACRCWGLNFDCPSCGGNGRPGTMEVDPAAFAQLVVPLLQAQPELFMRHLGAVEVVTEQQQ